MNTSRSNDLYKLFPPRTSEDGKKLCRNCGKELTGRRTSWCSDECKLEAHIVCYPSFAREAVFRRDKGICSKCGVNAQKLQRAVYRVTWRLQKAKNSNSLRPGRNDGVTGDGRLTSIIPAAGGMPTTSSR